MQFIFFPSFLKTLAPLDTLSLPAIVLFLQLLDFFFVVNHRALPGRHSPSSSTRSFLSKLVVSHHTDSSHPPHGFITPSAPLLHIMWLSSSSVMFGEALLLRCQASHLKKTKKSCARWFVFVRADLIRAIFYFPIKSSHKHPSPSRVATLLSSMWAAQVNRFSFPLVEPIYPFFTYFEPHFGEFCWFFY